MSFNPLTHYLFNVAKKAIPVMSDTEQQAIDAGDTWWEKEVFSGRPNWDKFQQLRFSQLSPEEQAFLDHETNELCAMIDDWQICHEIKDLPEDVWSFMRQKGFFGLVIDTQYGGKGFSAAAHSAVVLKIATRSMTAAVTVMVPNSLGPAELLQHYGTDEQKDHYLPRLAVGEEVPCFGLTSDHAGSDAGSMIDEGVVCNGEYNGETVLGIRLNFSKRYITLAPIATLIGLAFKLRDPDGLLGAQEEIGITLALLPRDVPGLEIGRRHIPLDIPFMNGPVVGKDVFIPIDFIIGGRERAGQGWTMLMECLSIGRSISLPAVGAANAAVSFLSASAYASIRKQFKLAINRFEGIENKLGRIGGTAYAIEAMRGLTLSAVDNGIKPSICSAIAKYHMTELSRTILNDAMDIHGGKAIILGPSNYLGRNYQGVPIGITVEGANILTRNLIIFGQGSVRCHRHLLPLFQSIKNDDVSAFGKVIYRFVGSACASYFRAACIGFTAGRFINTPESDLKKYYQRITRMSSVLALASDVALMVLGGKLKRKENLSARLGDVLSYLTMACAVLKQWETSKFKKEEKASAQWALDFCLFEAQEAMYGFLRHFPNRFAAWVIKRKCFFWGRPYKYPSDFLAHQVAQDMVNNEHLRQRYSNLSYMGPGNLADLEQALKDGNEALIEKIIAVDAFDEWR